MSRYRTQGLLAVGFGLAAAGCEPPVLATDLRPAGPPDVLATLTINPLSGVETSVQCKYVGTARDPKGPGVVFGAEICPDEVADFAPDRLEPRIDGVSWGIRVMFDELLNGDLVETLNCTEVPDVGEICEGSFDDTQPVTLRCGADNTEVSYRGYYVPNGNNTTLPLGPSIVIQPNPGELVFATGSTCTVALKPDRIKDKDGESPPAADLSIAAQIADLALIAVDPVDEEDPADRATISPDPVAAGAAAFVFNASIDDTMLDPAAFEISAVGGAALPTTFAADAYNTAGLTDAVYVFPNTTTKIFLPGAYSATMKPTRVTEANGGTLMVAAAQTTRFNVAFGKTGQTSGTNLAVNAPIRISFNNTIDPASIGADDLEMFTTTAGNAPVTFTTAVGNSTSAALNNVPNNAIIITPSAELPLGTHVVRFKAGAEVQDTAATPNKAKFSAPVAITYNVLLQPTHTLPATGGTLPIAGSFDIIWSGSLDTASVGAQEFQLTDLTTMMPVPMTIEMATSVSRPAPSPGSHPNDTIRIKPSANLIAARMYQVKMKAGTQLKSGNGITRTFATATTWNFTAN